MWGCKCREHKLIFHNTLSSGVRVPLEIASYYTLLTYLQRQRIFTGVYHDRTRASNNCCRINSICAYEQKLFPLRTINTGKVCPQNWWNPPHSNYPGLTRPWITQSVVLPLIRDWNRRAPEVLSNWDCSMTVQLGYTIQYHAEKLRHYSKPALTHTWAVKHT